MRDAARCLARGAKSAVAAVVQDEVWGYLEKEVATVNRPVSP